MFHLSALFCRFPYSNCFIRRQLCKHIYWSSRLYISLVTKTAFTIHSVFALFLTDKNETQPSDTENRWWSRLRDNAGGIGQPRVVPHNGQVRGVWVEDAIEIRIDKILSTLHER
jgi:hypothetical protein